MQDDDYEFALALQLSENDSPSSYSDSFIPSPQHRSDKRTIVGVTVRPTDSDLEVVDPTPDIHQLFMGFNKQFFEGKLDGVEVHWAPQMKVCAGVCRYEGRGGFCSIGLSKPLLKYRPRSDLVETLLHEMIHAYLFVAEGNREREEHGPNFKYHMKRINDIAKTNITIYHTFHDEVNLYRQHWWRCDGPCKHWKPFYGLVKRTMNRAPGPNDNWWANHLQKCGGSFTKVKEPEGFKARKRKGEVEGTKSESPPGKKPNQGTLDGFVAFTGKGNVLGGSDTSPKPQGKPTVKTAGKGNVLGGSGTSPKPQVKPTVKTAVKGGGKIQTQGDNMKGKKKNIVPVFDILDGKVQQSQGNTASTSKQPTMDMFITPPANQNPPTTTPVCMVTCDWCGNIFPEDQHCKQCLEECSAPNTSDELLPCPVCNKVIVMSHMNQHLDTCLS